MIRTNILTTSVIGTVAIRLAGVCSAQLKISLLDYLPTHAPISKFLVAGQIQYPTEIYSCVLLPIIVVSVYFVQTRTTKFPHKMKTSLSISLFIISYLIRQARAVDIGPCHPYRGAVAQDCLDLIRDNLGNDTSLDLASSDGVTLYLRNCGIVTKATTAGGGQIEVDTVVRRALTAIGTCALNDLGSISGAYTGDDGVKTCYLYPGKYVHTTVSLFNLQNTNPVSSERAC